MNSDAGTYVLVMENGRDRLECEWNRLLADNHDRFPVRGFGATDCACSSHLHFFGHRPESDQVARLHRTLSGIAKKRGK